jgi:hypothetical protein
MASATIAPWADSGTIIMDTPDTCVVQVTMIGYTFTYSIDMQSGLIFLSSTMVEGGGPQFFQFYLYGEYNGINYIRRVCCIDPSIPDTTLNNGGYDFYNIRINGEPVTPVINPPRAREPRFAIRSAERGAMKVFYGGNEPARMSFYDLRGRTLFSTFLIKETGAVRLDKACPSGRCPGGRYIIRLETAGSAPYSTVVTRQ